MMKQEPGIHRLLLEKTTVPVAPIIAFNDKRDVINHDLIIMERLPGVPLSDALDLNRDRILAQVGESLAQVHALTTEPYGYVGEHHPMTGQDTWNEAFWMMWNLLIDDVVSVDGYTDEEATMLRQLLDDHEELFDRSVPSSLLHMDVWVQNILVDQKKGLTGLVDWDRALWGDPEIEFAVLDYCGISEPAFWEGYGSHRDTSPEAGVRNVFYLLYELQKYIIIRSARHGDHQAAERYKQQVFNMVRKVFT